MSGMCKSLVPTICRYFGYLIHVWAVEMGQVPRRDSRLSIVHFLIHSMHCSGNSAITSISKRIHFILISWAASTLAEPLPVKSNLQAVFGRSPRYPALHCIVNSHMVNFHQFLAQQVPVTGYETDIVKAVKHMNEQGVMRG